MPRKLIMRKVLVMLQSYELKLPFNSAIKITTKSSVVD